MVAKPVLPAPPVRYDPGFERNRNAAIERLLGDRLGNNELPEFPGSPALIFHGSNSAFAVPTGAAYTTLPFDAGYYSSADFGGSLVSGLATITYAMQAFQSINLLHAAGGVTIDVNCEIGVYRNGVLNKSLYQRVPFNSDTNINLTDVLANLDYGETVQLRMRHDYAANFLINMIASTWMISQLTPNPKLMETRPS